MKIGIIGAENSHTAAIARIINVDKAIKGFSVDYLWGETPEFAKAAAEAGKIPHIVKTPKEMLGKVHGVVVDHRHAKFHLPVVKPFIEKGVPTFVDKPFCYRSKEGKEFLALARKKGTPVTSFSVLPHYDTFQAFKKRIAALGPIVSASSYGPCDLESQWGGVFFYGIHQVDIMLHAFGYDVEAVLITRNGQNATGQLLYPSGLVATMALIKEGCPGFGIGAVGTKGSFFTTLESGTNPYLNGTRTFTHMFKTGKEPLTYEQILRPVQVLEAMEKSVKSGKVVKVDK
jgi:predicted dehydrogenase